MDEHLLEQQIIIVGSIRTCTFDNSQHKNDNGKVNYVADNKMPPHNIMAYSME